MKNLLLRVLAGIMLIVFSFLGYNAVANAETITKTLTEDTQLIPPGNMAILSVAIPVFKKGTTVTINENGEVLEGTLASDPGLNCVSLKYEVDGVNFLRSYGYVFRVGTKVTFNDKGEVIKGTLSHNHNNTIVVPVGPKSGVILRPLTEVSFHPNGILASGTLDVIFNTYLRPVGWSQLLTKNLVDSKSGFVEFKAGTPIEINIKGEVTKGTLNQDTKLLSPSGIIKVYEAGTTVEFDDKGVVIKSSK